MTRYSRTPPRGGRGGQSIRGYHVTTQQRSQGSKNFKRTYDDRRSPMQDELNKQRRMVAQNERNVHYYREADNDWSYGATEDWQDERDGQFYHNYRRWNDNDSVD